MKVMAMLREVEGVVDVDLDWRTGRPEIRMIPDRLRMGRLNFSSENLSDLLRGYVTGLKAGVFREGGKEYDILVKLSAEEVSSPFQLPDLPFPTSAGFVSLQDLAELKDTMGPTQILRKDRQRSITVDANVYGTTVGEVYQVIDRKLKESPSLRGIVSAIRGRSSPSRTISAPWVSPWAWRYSSPSC